MVPRTKNILVFLQREKKEISYHESIYQSINCTKTFQVSTSYDLVIATNPIRIFFIISGEKKKRQEKLQIMIQLDRLLDFIVTLKRFRSSHDEENRYGIQQIFKTLCGIDTHLMDLT